MQIFSWGLGITEPLRLNMSEMFYHALRWYPEMKSLNRVDANAVMLEIFRSKRLIRPALDAMKRIIELFEERLLSKIEKDRATGTYKHHSADTKIQKVAQIMKADLMDVKRIIHTHIQNKNVKCASFYTYLNETATEALKNDRRWQTYLTMNTMVDNLFYRGDIPIDQWIINASLGFNEDEYKRELERKKERNLHAAQMRQTIDLQKSFITNWGKSKGGYNNNNNYNNRNVKKKIKKSFKQIMSDHKAFLRIHAPKTEFIKDYCAFWNHPTEECKNKNSCNRYHKCHNCDGDHGLHECPHFETTNTSSSSKTNKSQNTQKN